MFGKKKEEKPVALIEVIVPKVDKIQYVKVKMKMSNGKEQDGYRLVCPCGNYDRDKYGNYRKTIIERGERNRTTTTVVMALICKVCGDHDIPFDEFGRQYDAIIKNTKHKDSTIKIK